MDKLYSVKRNKIVFSRKHLWYIMQFWPPLYLTEGIPVKMFWNRKDKEDIQPGALTLMRSENIVKYEPRQKIIFD